MSVTRVPVKVELVEHRSVFEIIVLMFSQQTVGKISFFPERSEVLGLKQLSQYSVQRATGDYRD